jgi:hypothetical protein
MSAYYVKSTGSNTAPYDTWAKAATAIKTAIDYAVSQSDTSAIIYVDNAFTDTITASTVFTGYSTMQVISTSDTTNAPPLTYAAGATLDGSGTSGVDLTLNGGRWFGFTFKSGTGTGICDISLNANNLYSGVWDSCSFYTGGTSSSTRINVGRDSTAAARVYTRTINCSFYWNATTHGFTAYQDWEDEGSDFCAGATVPATLLRAFGGRARWQGSDLTDIVGTLVNGTQNGVCRLELWGCKLGSGVTFLGSQTTPGGDVFVYDCASDDTQYNFAHYNWLGSTTISTSIVMSSSDAAKYDGSNAHSFVVTGVNATYATPYNSPWIDAYHDATAAITPYIEILRDGSTTAYTDKQVWAEFLAKVTSGSTRATFYTDKCGPLATAASQANGTGTANWTGENASAKSMKCDSGASFTPAESGHIRGRICVGDAITVYVNPKILGR